MMRHIEKESKLEPPKTAWNTLVSLNEQKKNTGNLECELRGESLERNSWKVSQDASLEQQRLL